MIKCTVWLLILGTLAISASEPECRVYSKTPQGELSLCIYSPAVSTKPSPAVVFFFGGGWRNGSINQFKPHSVHLASRGMVSIVADYRVNSRQKTTPYESVEDAMAAMVWVRKHAMELNIDPQRIAAGGGSAGGHLAAATATLAGSETVRPNALLLFNPVLDVTETGVGSGLFGPDPNKGSPMQHVSKGMPPTLIQHGTADTTVKIEQAERFCRLMTTAGNRCKLIPYEAATHGFFNYKENTDNKHFKLTLQAADDFLVSLGWLPENLKSH